MSKLLTYILRVVEAICALLAAIVIVFALENASWRRRTYETGYAPYTIFHYVEEGLWKNCSDDTDAHCTTISIEKTGKI